MATPTIEQQQIIAAGSRPLAPNETLFIKVNSVA